jgi:hypothetical protein
MARLYQMAKAAVDDSKGIIEEVIFPAAPERWLLTLIEEVEKGSGLYSAQKISGKPSLLKSATAKARRDGKEARRAALVKLPYPIGLIGSQLEPWCMNSSAFEGKRKLLFFRNVSL